MEIDERLITGLARDLDATYPAVVEAHRDRLYTIALRMLGHPADAEEVAQDALVRAYRALASYDAGRRAAIRLTPWLASITVNLARNKRRRIIDRRPPLALAGLVDSADEPADRAVSPEDHALGRERSDALAAALLALPPAVRAPIVLRHVVGLSLAETALALGRPEGTIKAQVSRGLARLRLILAEPIDPDGGDRRVPLRTASRPAATPPIHSPSIPRSTVAVEVTR